jgi:uncharacterized lipoprotein YddW (UPF0748 family)
MVGKKLVRMRVMKKSRFLFPLLAVVGSMVLVWLVLAQQLDQFVYLPTVVKPEPPPPMVEFRGLWVTRFDWTAWNGAHPAKIDEIVQNAADAGFNVLFFQIRGEADAYYASDLEPWSKRISGNALGDPPGAEWDGLGDPLEYMITKAHEAGLQVHAYMNVYPVTSCTTLPEDTVLPTPIYQQLIAEHGVTPDGDGEKVNGLQWLIDGRVYCSGDNYLWASPASEFYDTHVVSVTKDIATRYAIDGLHLDRVRYANRSASCDPVSLAETGECFGAAPAGYASYEDWQRDQVNNLVARIYTETLAVNPDLWLSAAVWPIHKKDPAWDFPGSPQQGFFTYYQDSKGWLNGNYIDSISPMIYPGTYNECDEDGNYIENPDLTSSDYWLKSRWQPLVAD